MTPTENCCRLPESPLTSQLKKEAIRLPAYSVEELGGLIFAYFGAQPAPLLPRYNFLVGEGDVYITIQGSRTVTGCSALKTVWTRSSKFTHGGAWPDIMEHGAGLRLHQKPMGPRVQKRIGKQGTTGCSTTANIIC